jgi:hypothetical protein
VVFVILEKNMEVKKLEVSRKKSEAVNRNGRGEESCDQLLKSIIRLENH